MSNRFDELSPREQWALTYLSERREPISAIFYFDDGADFLAAYAAEFLTLSDDTDKVQRSIYRVLMKLRSHRLVETREVSNHHGSIAGGGPPSHCLEYSLTWRGKEMIEEMAE